MINQVFTTKSHMSQTFVEGKRVPVTVLSLPAQIVSQIKTGEKDGYLAIQVAIGKKNRPSNKPQLSHLKPAKIEYQPRWFGEIILTDQASDLKPGDTLPITEIISVGDSINVTGTSLGKGFAGVMKRHGFAGGPRTHGQSDRSRAPGSIGRGTTPGRVLPGKKMAGHMGNVTITTKNLKVISIDPEKNEILVSGPVPGYRGQLVRLTVTKKSTIKSEANN